MTIRLAVDDSKAELAADRTDTTLVLAAVKAGSGPTPPNESVASIGERIADPRFVCMIDDGPDTVAGFYVVREGNPDAPVVEAKEPHVIVIWWLPRASWAEDNMPLLMPVFGKACEEVLKRYPGSEDWPIYGDYPGVGKDFDERDRSSSDMVSEWVTLWNSSPTVGVFAQHKLNPYNQSQHRPVGTVGKVVQFADWLAKERRR